MRGQVSLEYLLVTGFAFIFIIPIIALYYSQSSQLNEDITSAQADRIASEIVEAANEVYYLGEPSKKTLTAYMPENVKSITFQESSISIRVDSSSGEFDVVKVAAMNLTGSIDIFSGIHKIEVTARSNYVEITG
ncbi:hypothetical protein ACFL1B_01390 [Nanoarchaeota archaeon]